MVVKSPSTSYVSFFFQKCEHNTEGEECETCVEGFYGDPTNKSAGDCKPCACPLLTPDNNFSPLCEIKRDGLNISLPGEYTCISCKEGYSGDHCEM